MVRLVLLVLFLLEVAARKVSVGVSIYRSFCLLALICVICSPQAYESHCFDPDFESRYKDASKLPIVVFGVDVLVDQRADFPTRVTRAGLFLLRLRESFVCVYDFCCLFLRTVQWFKQASTTRTLCWLR
jgi:hypothetical protein